MDVVDKSAAAKLLLMLTAFAVVIGLLGFSGVSAASILALLVFVGVPAARSAAQMIREDRLRRIAGAIRNADLRAQIAWATSHSEATLKLKKEAVDSGEFLRPLRELCFREDTSIVEGKSLADSVEGHQIAGRALAGIPGTLSSPPDLIHASPTELELPAECSAYERLVLQLENREPSDEDFRDLEKHEAICPSGRHTEEAVEESLGLPRGSLVKGSLEHSLRPPSEVVSELIHDTLGFA